MARKMIEVDTKKLLDMVGKTSPKQIMKELGIKTKAQLERLYLKALVDAGKVKPLKHGKDDGDRMIKVNGKGTLMIPKSVVESLGLKPGDKVTIKISRSVLTLRPVEKKKDEKTNGTNKKGNARATKAKGK